jgi:PAS domain-containing protein
MGKLDNVFERNTLISTLYIDIGNKSTILVNIDDITERVQMENILREKNALLVKAQEIAKVGEFYYDIKTKTFKLSDSLAKITGQDSNIMSVEEMYNSIHPDDREDTRIYYRMLWQISIIIQTYIDATNRW